MVQVMLNSITHTLDLLGLPSYTVSGDSTHAKGNVIGSQPPAFPKGQASSQELGEVTYSFRQSLSWQAPSDSFGGDSPPAKSDDFGSDSNSPKKQKSSDDSPAPRTKPAGAAAPKAAPTTAPDNFRRHLLATGGSAGVGTPGSAARGEGTPGTPASELR